MANGWEDLPSSGGGTSSNASVGTNGITAPTSSTEIGFINASGNLIGVSPSNPLPVDIHIDTVTVSENLAQVGGVTVAVGTGLSNTGTQRMAVSSDSTIGVSGNVTVVQPSGSALHANIDNFPSEQSVNLNQVGGSSLNIGQQLSSASLPVVLPAAQITSLTPPTTVTVQQGTGSNLHAVIDSGSVNATVSGTVAVSSLPSIPAGSNAIGSVSVSNFPGTQPVSGTVAVSSLPSIPAGTNAIGSITNTSFAATQTTASAFNATVVGTGTFATQVTSLPALPTGSNTIGAISNTSFAATQSTASALNATVVGTGTFATQVTSSALPTGAATSALQTQISGQLPTTLGAKTTANSLAINIASDQTVPVTQGGFAASNAPVYNAYASTNVTTSAYVQLIASTTSATRFIDIFDSSGQAMILAVGGAGSEVIQAYVPPGGDAFSFAIPAGSRVAYKALTGNATAGYLLLNLRG
jgi:hypothetical protein